MAIDTASRRSAAINVGCAWRGLWPIPDGTVGREDKVHVAYHYAGLPPYLIYEISVPSAQFVQQSGGMIGRKYV